MKIKVYVTEKHIEEGVRNDCNHCPIALAVGDTLNNNGVVWFGWVKVNHLYVLLISKLGSEIIHRVSEEMKEFIEIFDAGKSTPKPFCFELDLIESIYHGPRIRES